MQFLQATRVAFFFLIVFGGGLNARRFMAQFISYARLTRLVVCECLTVNVVGMMAISVVVD